MIRKVLQDEVGRRAVLSIEQGGWYEEGGPETGKHSMVGDKKGARDTVRTPAPLRALRCLFEVLERATESKGNCHWTRTIA